MLSARGPYFRVRNEMFVRRSCCHHTAVKHPLLVSRIVEKRLSKDAPVMGVHTMFYPSFGGGVCTAVCV